MNKIYNFNVYCGRMGSLRGMFVADSDDVDAIIGRDIYFGEVLGKHSEVILEMKPEHFEAVEAADEDFVDKFIQIFGSGTVSGYNPFDYLEDDDEGNDNDSDD